MPFQLTIAKALKVIRIEFGFLFPTLKIRLLLWWYKCPTGKYLRACGPIHIRPNTLGSISIGSHVVLTARFLTNTVGISSPLMLETIADGEIEIGNYSGLSASILSARTNIKIGQYVKVGANVRIFDHDFHSTNFSLRRNSRLDNSNVKSSPVLIEDDVFIGSNTIILKGVSIGARSIIGSGSVLAHISIPPDSLVAGNPARIISATKDTI